VISNCLSQTEVEAAYIDDLLVAFTSVYCHHVITSRNKPEALGLIEVRRSDVEVMIVSWLSTFEPIEAVVAAGDRCRNS
jgi:hypothetical protein